jgi:hypothetical protein
VYVALTALTPVLYPAHQRWGLAVPAVMAAAGIAVDFTVIYAGIKPLGWLNYLLIWGAVYQAGFAWQDGTLTRDRRVLPALGTGGALLFAGLVLLGPFPPSLIGVPGDRINNTAPPSAALAAYMAVQISLVVAAAPAARRWLRRPRPWRAVSRSNSIVMTVYLWHMVPAVIGGTLLYLTGVMPQPAVGSARWWELRPVWVGVLGVLLSLLLYALAPLTRIVGNLGSGGHRRRAAKRADRDAGADADIGIDVPVPEVPPPSDLRHIALLWVGLALAGYALYRFAVFGFAPDGAFPVTAAVCYAAGTALVLLGAPARASHHS